MSFPLKLEVISTVDVKTKKYWRRIQWDGGASDNICLLGRRTLAQLNLTTGKKKRVDASVRRLLGKVVYINTSTSGDCVVGMLQDGKLFRWRKKTKTITNISPCPDFSPTSGEQENENRRFKRPKIFVADDGDTILLFSRHCGVYIWRGVGFDNSGWTRVTMGNSASGLLSSKHTSVDAVFYNDLVQGPVVACAFLSFTGENLTIGILTLKLGQPQSSCVYHVHNYPSTDFCPPCLPLSGKSVLLPCWSRNGRTLAVAVNQKRPALAKILLIQPHTGGIISVGFADVLSKYVDLSFWMSNLSWTHDNLYLACSTKQGAVLVISASGNIMQLIAESAIENFGPGIFLPLEGLVGFRRPALNAGHELEESTDTSMQSTVVPPKKRKPNFTVSAHPTRAVLLCGDGNTVVSIKIANLARPHDVIVSNLENVIQKLSDIVRRQQLQVTLLEPLSYFLPAENENVEKMTDQEEQWRIVVKNVNIELSGKNEADIQVIEKTELDSLAHFIREQMNESEGDIGFKSEMSRMMQVSKSGLLSNLTQCRSNLLASLVLMLMTSDDRNDYEKYPALENQNNLNGFTVIELHNLFMTSLKLFCDILLQLQEVADIIPIEDDQDEYKQTLRSQMCDTIYSLGSGILTLLPWNEVTKATSPLVSMAINEIVNSMLICSRNSSEGCLGIVDVHQNVHRAFLFLMKAEALMSKNLHCHHNSLHSDVISPVCLTYSQSAGDNYSEDERIDCGCSENNKFYFTCSWRSLINHITMLQSLDLKLKESTIFNSLTSYIQSLVAKQLVTSHDVIDDDVIMATKNLLHMCNCLSNYDFCNAMSSAHGILSYLLTNTEKLTDEKWLPVEILASVMTSYFCGSVVEVPSCLTSLAKCTIKNPKSSIFEKGNCVKTAFDFSNKLQQKVITSIIRDHSLDESWNINNAILLLLSCGLLQKASEIGSTVGDWRTSLVLSAVFSKTSFCETRKMTAEVVDVATILKHRFIDVLTSVLAVKVEIAEENTLRFLITGESNFSEVNPMLHTKCFTDIYKVSAMVGVNMTSWPVCALLDVVKTRCRDSGVSLIVPEIFKLPHPQLYLPPSLQDSKEPEARLRMELSAFLRTLLTIFHSIGISRIVAQWFFKWLNKQSKRDHPLHLSLDGKTNPKNVVLSDETFLKDVSLQGLEIDVELMHSNACDEEIYILAAVFREVCTISWIFHLRDKLSTSLRRYQAIREKRYCQNGFNSTESPTLQKDVEDSILVCIFWIRKINPFAKFMRFEADLADLTLCLISELPINIETVKLVAEFFHNENIVPKNKHKLQVITEKIRKTHVSVEPREGDNNASSKSLSAVFNEECKRLRANMRARKFSSIYGVPVSSHFDTQKSNKSIATCDNSQFDTLTRDESSKEIEVTPQEILKTLNICYSFECDDTYHAYILEFLDITLSKTPPSTTFTPKKERKSRIASRPLQYPLVLTYRNEIAKAELDMVPPSDGEDITSIVMKIPTLENGIHQDTVLASIDSKTNAEQKYFSYSQAKIEPEIFGSKHSKLNCAFVSGDKFIPRINLDQVSPQFRKRLSRLIPYFAWLEHWRAKSVNVPQTRHRVNKGNKLAMRITTTTQHLVHGFTVAEIRFGKNMKFKTKPKINEEVDISEAATICSDKIDGQTLSGGVSFVEDDATGAKAFKEPDIRATRPLETFDQPSKDLEKFSQKEEDRREVQIASSPEKPDDTVIEALEISKKQIEENKNIDVSPGKDLEIEDLHSEIPEPSTGNFLREVMGEDNPQMSHPDAADRMDLNHYATVASQSALSTASTGLQSDVLADGGGKYKRSRMSQKKETEKLQMKEYVHKEIQSVIVQQQVFLLANILQSVASHASSYQMQPSGISVRQEPQTQTLQPRKIAGRLKILTIDGRNSYVTPKLSDSVRPKQPRVPLKILTENDNFRASKTALLHDERSNAPKMYTGETSTNKQPNTQIMYDERNRPVYTENERKTEEKPTVQNVIPNQDKSILTPDMLQNTKKHSFHQQPQEERPCPTCHSHTKPKSATRLPLLSLAGPMPDRNRQQAYQQTVPIPRLVGLQQVLQYEQKRMDTTGQQSKSIRHVGQHFPLLDASNIPDFYRLKPKFREIPMMKQSSQMQYKSSPVPHIVPEAAKTSTVSKKDAKAVRFEEEPRIPIPSELLPKVLSPDEVDKIRNGVLSHYKIICDQQKTMLREAGQQTDVLEEEEMGTIESGEQSISLIRPPKRARADPYEMHQEFVERFLNVDSGDIDRSEGSVDANDFKIDDVAQSCAREMEMQVPATQKLVKSRWSSVMNQMSSEMDVMEEMDRDMQSRYEIPVPESVVTRAKPPVGIEHMMMQEQQVNGRQVTSRSRSRSPPSLSVKSSHSLHQEIFGGIKTRILQEQSTPTNIQRKAQFEQDFTHYRRTIDEALNLADQGITPESVHSALSSLRQTPTSSNSMHRIDETLSSLSWNELEAMITESVLLDAETDDDRIIKASNVDGRIQDALQLLNELQSDQTNLDGDNKKSTAKKKNSKKSKKINADVDARIQDALSLLNEIKTDQRQIGTGRAVKKGALSGKGKTTSKGVDNWTMEAMSLLKELKTELEPENRISSKENLSPDILRKTDSDDIRAHIEQAMELLKDDS